MRRKLIRKVFLTVLNFTLFFCTSCSGGPQKSASASAQANSASRTTLAQPSPQQQAEGLIPPEVVRSEEVRIKDGAKLVTVGNAHGRYHLWCNIKTESCITPMPAKDYLVFASTTRWQFPGAPCCATLQLFEALSVTYNNQENIALVPADRSSAEFGMYGLNSWEKKP